MQNATWIAPKTGWYRTGATVEPEFIGTEASEPPPPNSARVIDHWDADPVE